MSLGRVTFLVACVSLALGALIATHWPHADISGVYVGGGPNTARLLQIVQNNERHLSGRFEETNLKADGTIDRNSAAIVGDVSGENIVFSFKPFAPLPMEVTASGTVKGDRIVVSLSGLGVFGQGTLEQSDMASYQAKVDALVAQGRQIAAQRAAAAAKEQEQRAIAEARQQEQRAAAAAMQRETDERSRQIRETLSFMARAGDWQRALDDRAKSLADVGTRYRSITEKMRGYLDRQRKLPIINATSYERTQLSQTIEQGVAASESLHDSVVDRRQAFDSTRSNIMREVEEVRSRCRTARKPTAEQPVPSDQAEWHSTCIQALDTLPSLLAKLDRTANSYQQAEAVYRQEAATQRQIAKTADDIADR